MECSDVRDKLYDYAFELLDPGEERAVEAHLESCNACREAYADTLRERALLRQWQTASPPDGLAETTIRRAGVAQTGGNRQMDANRSGNRGASRPLYELVESDWRWFGTPRFWRAVGAVAAVLVLAVALHTVWIATRTVPTAEAILFSRESLAAGQPAPFRVLVRDGRRQEPIPNAAVRVVLASTDGRPVLQTAVLTDANGMAAVDDTIPPDLPDGEYTVTVTTDTGRGEAEVTRTVTAARAFRVLVATDKPLYQPGQTIHIRTLGLNTNDGRPAAGQDVVIAVKDAEENLVFKHRAKTSAFGICSADFELADQVNEGEYQIVAEMGDGGSGKPGVSSERTVRVERYVLPKYRVDLKADRTYYAPGEIVTGTVTANYTFGEPVANAKVEVIGSEFIDRFREIARINGHTNDGGIFTFRLPLKDWFAGIPKKKGDAVLSLEARVVDGAGHKQNKTAELTVSARPIRIELFPESGSLVQGVENILYIFTAYPDGRPAKTRLEIGKTREKAETSDAGIAKVRIAPKTANLKLTVAAVDERGVRAETTQDLRVGDRSETVLLRTDRAVYRSGSTARLTVLSADPVGRVFVDIVKDRRTALMKTLDVADGLGELALDLPADLFGTLEVNAYKIGPDGMIHGDTRLIQVNRADALTVKATLDQETYRPAETALMKFAVTRRDGLPTAAALSLAGVDEAVFALSEMRPGLERMYFALQEELLKPRYQITALPASPREVVDPVEPQSPEREEATVVLFSAASGGEPPTREASTPYADRRAAYEERRESHFERLRAGIALLPSGLFALLVLPLLAYALAKLINRRPADSVPKLELAAVGLRAAMLNGAWVMAWYVPPVLAFVAAFVADHFHLYGREEVAALVALGVGFVAMLIVLATASSRLRRTPAMASAPRFRSLVRLLPWAYALAGLAFIGLGIATDARVIDEDAGVPLMLALPIAAVLVVPAISIGSAALRKPLTSVGWIGIAISRPVVTALPILLVGMLLPALGRARNDSMALNAAGRAGGIPLGIDAMEFAAPAATPDFAEPEERTALVLDESGAMTNTSSSARPTRVRRHFPETLFWKPQLITDESGRAELSIPLADSITTWRVAMSAVSAKGELGSATAGIRVFQDFFVDVDFPVHLTQNDHVSVPVAVYNYLDRPQTVRLEAEERPWFRLDGGAVREVKVGPRQVTSVHFPLTALRPGTHAFLVRARGDKLADAVERTVRVRPDGRRVDEIVNGFLDENRTHELVIPDHAIDGSLDLVVKVYPGAFSQVIEGLDGIFQMPHGCFEQTSSTTYPNVLALDYLRRTKQIKPDIEMKATRFVKLGYQRLVSYEVDGGGFDWFGNPPAHLALTAYGLMQFCDMARVHEVDPKVIERTRAWLLRQRKDDGTWSATRDGIAEGAINSTQGNDLRTTAYVAWALAESDEGDADVRNALEVVHRTLDVKQADTYTLALCANAMIAADHRGAGRVMKELDARKKAEGKLAWWDSTGHTEFHGAGASMHVETTALVAYAFQRARFNVTTAHHALAWLVRQKGSHGTWGTTQATVAAMRALLAGTERGGKAEIDGAVKVAVTGNGKLAKELTITKDNSDVFHLISLRELVNKGANHVALETAGASPLAYQIFATHYVPWSGEKAEPREKAVSIDVAYNATELRTDDVLVATVTVQYDRTEPANMTIVDLGVPPGFDVVADGLAKLVQEKVVERYELTGRQVILYFRTLPPGEPVRFEYALRAKHPVKAKTPQSLVYQYYEPEVRDVAEPVLLTVR
jgi:uncharacterized protein YfaS (alpha-2-macroglobulin family)